MFSLLPHPKRPVLVHEERLSRHWRDGFFVPSSYADERALSPRLRATKGKGKGKPSRPQSAKASSSAGGGAEMEHPWYLTAAARERGPRGDLASSGEGPRSPDGGGVGKKPAYKTPGVTARTGFRVPPEPSTYPDLPCYREREGKLPYTIPPEARVLTPEERRLAEVKKIEREIAVERALAEVLEIQRKEKEREEREHRRITEVFSLQARGKVSSLGEMAKEKREKFIQKRIEAEKLAKENLEKDAERRRIEAAERENRLEAEAREREAMLRLEEESKKRRAEKDREIQFKRLSLIAEREHQEWLQKREEVQNLRERKSSDWEGTEKKRKQVEKALEDAATMGKR